MILELIATLCAGLFAGAAIYVSLVEHPTRLQCDLAPAAAGLLLGAVVPFTLHALRSLASGIAFPLLGLPRPGTL